MDTKQQAAVINYLEFNLVELVKAMEPHTDPDAVGVMYDRAYKLLNDMEDALHVCGQLNPADPVRG